MKNIISILALLTIVSCAQGNKKELTESTFNFPLIIQSETIETVEYFNEDHITFISPIFAGKSKFCDALKLSIRRDIDTNLTKDYIEDYIVWHSDTLRKDGLELFPDYQSKVSRIDDNYRKGKYFYPVYLVNQTPATKVFIGKDSHVFAVQEALDTNQKWRPIEGRAFDFCGNGYWGLKIHSKEFVTFLMPIYKGNFKTKIRVRIEIGDTIYVSKPFEGTINKKQFYLRKAPKGWRNKPLIENKVATIQHWFYGSVPIEAEDENFGIYVERTE